MSATIVLNPAIKAIGPFSYSDQRTISYDFVNLILSGESINSSTVSISSSPSGFTLSTPTVSGTAVIFQTTAPTVAGYYIISVSLSTQGLAVTQHLTRSAKAQVLQL